MVIATPSFPRAHSKRFPMDYLGAIALVWAGAFTALAFALSYWLG